MALKKGMPVPELIRHLETYPDHSRRERLHLLTAAKFSKSPLIARALGAVEGHLGPMKYEWDRILRSAYVRTTGDVLAADIWKAPESGDPSAEALREGRVLLAAAHLRAVAGAFRGATADLGESQWFAWFENKEGIDGRLPGWERFQELAAPWSEARDAIDEFLGGASRNPGLLGRGRSWLIRCAGSYGDDRTAQWLLDFASRAETMVCEWEDGGYPGKRAVTFRRACLSGVVDCAGEAVASRAVDMALRRLADIDAGAEERPDLWLVIQHLVDRSGADGIERDGAIAAKSDREARKVKELIESVRIRRRPIR